LFVCLILARGYAAAAAGPSLALNELEYLEMPGLNVMLAQDYYPEGHQGGVSIIQNGRRVASNGDLRLDAAPGQWQAVPKVGPRTVDRRTQEISVRMEYPDPARNGKGYNPISYPDLRLSYTVRVVPAGRSFRIIVDLDRCRKPGWGAWVSTWSFSRARSSGGLTPLTGSRAFSRGNPMVPASGTRTSSTRSRRSLRGAD
jgi:hypothetical protein